MVDIARLAVTIDSSDLAKGKSAMKGFATEGKRTEAQIVKSADRMERELAQTAVAAQKVSRGFGGNGLRMASLQLSQVAQQGAATGNYLQALAIQLPDLALGFGTVGIMAGIAAGALLPLAANFFGASDSTKAMTASLDSFGSAVEQYRAASDLATASTRSLREEFGAYANELRGTLEILQQIALSRALDGLNVAVEQIDVEKLRSLVLLFRDGPSEMSIVSEGYNKAIAALREEYQLTGEQASRLLDGINALGQAEGPEAVSIAARNINDFFLETFGTVQNIPPVLREMAQHLAETDVTATRLQASMDESADAASALASTNIAFTIGAGADEAARLAENLGISLQTAQALAMARRAAERTDGVNNNGLDPLDPRNPNNVRATTWTGGYGTTPLNDPSRNPRISSSGGGRRGARSGGAGRSAAASQAAREAQRAQNELNREGERIIEGLRSEQEKHNDALKQAKRLLDAGILSQSQYNQHVAQLGQEFRDQMPFVQEWKDSVVDAAMGSADAFENLAEAIKRAALEYLLFGEGAFAPQGGTGGGLLDGLVSSLFGGFKASGGPVSAGKGYIVGENGPEWFAPSRSGSIVPNHQLGGGGQMDVRVYVDQDGNWQAKVEQISGGVVQRAAPGIAAQSVNRAQASFRNSKSGWTP